MYANFRELEKTHNYTATIAKHATAYIGMVLIFTLSKVLEVRDRAKQVLACLIPMAP
jgi:hypothetical protein